MSTTWTHDVGPYSSFIRVGDAAKLICMWNSSAIKTSSENEGLSDRHLRSPPPANVFHPSLTLRRLTSSPQLKTSHLSTFLKYFCHLHSSQSSCWFFFQVWQITVTWPDSSKPTNLSKRTCRLKVMLSAWGIETSPSACSNCRILMTTKVSSVRDGPVN